MPCNGGSYFRTQYVEVESGKVIDHLTRLLCHACGVIDEAGVDMGKELDEWWYEHRLADEERKAEAKRRAEAEEAAVRRANYLSDVRLRVMKQLTDDEREALGL